MLKVVLLDCPVCVTTVNDGYTNTRLRLLQQTRVYII